MERSVNGQSVFQPVIWPTHVILVQGTVGTAQLFSSMFGFSLELGAPFLEMFQLRIVTLSGGLDFSLVSFSLRANGIEFPLHRP